MYCLFLPSFNILQPLTEPQKLPCQRIDRSIYKTKIKTPRIPVNQGVTAARLPTPKVKNVEIIMIFNDKFSYTAPALLLKDFATK